MKVKYSGPYAEGVEVPLPSGTVEHVLPGEVIDVPDDFGESLLVQEEIWVRPGAKKTKPASPSKAIKEFASNLGVDLSQVTGTGKNGSIKKADVQAAADAAAETAGTEPDAGTTEEA